MNNRAFIICLEALLVTTHPTSPQATMPSKASSLFLPSGYNPQQKSSLSTLTFVFSVVGTQFSLSANRMQVKIPLALFKFWVLGHKF